MLKSPCALLRSSYTTRTKCAISDAFVRDCVFAYCASVVQYVYSLSAEHCFRLRKNAITDERVRDCALSTHSVFRPLRTLTGCPQRCRARAGAAYILPRNATYWRCSVRNQRKCVISSGSIIFFSRDIFPFSYSRICLALSSFMHCFISNIFRAEMNRAGLRSKPSAEP